MWHDLLVALGLLLVIEGIIPFANPDGFRRAALQIAELEPRVLRAVGLASMVLGALIVYLVRY